VIGGVCVFGVLWDFNLVVCGMMSPILGGGVSDRVA